MGGRGSSVARRVWAAAAGAACVLAASAGIAPAGPGPARQSVENAAGAQPAPGAEQTGANVLGHTMTSIDGRAVGLDQYRGRVVLMVNVASKCGYTPQYKGLEALYQRYKDRGLVVLGFPSNDFGNQEPGSNAEIAEFCSNHFSVSFPMFEKIAVKGKGAHPLYQALAAEPAPIGGEPRWNFTKFLVDRRGAVVARFESKTEPQSEAMIERVEALLAEAGAVGGSQQDAAGTQGAGGAGDERGTGNK
ncbi:MAG: glutathione peroxidase [Isosphaera sp.]|nr:glutathione peroxidase [Isosphaera sp.]